MIFFNKPETRLQPVYMYMLELFSQNVAEDCGEEWPTSTWMILCGLVHQLGEITLPMESGCVDDQQVHKSVPQYHLLN